MAKSKLISILLIAFLVIVFILFAIGMINISFSEILYFLLITSGFGLVYIGIDSKISVIVFFGTAMFLLGVLLLTNLNFNVKIESTAFFTIALLISAVGFLMIYISNAAKKINLIISFLLFISASTLIITQTKFELTGFIQSILPLLNIYWPAVIIYILLVILLRKE